jgi:hypothetical protein
VGGARESSRALEEVRASRRKTYRLELGVEVEELPEVDLAALKNETTSAREERAGLGLAARAEEVPCPGRQIGGGRQRISP